MNKLYALFDLFKKGSSVLEPEKWKNRQITVTVLVFFINNYQKWCKSKDKS